MGKRGKNIRSRKKILEALETIHSPFSCPDMAYITGLEVNRTSTLLRDTDGVEKIPINRSSGLRVMYRVIL